MTTSSPALPYRPLRRKQNETGARFAEVAAHIEEIVPREHIDALRDRTLATMEASLTGKRYGYGWSGGKDSAVILSLIRQLAAPPTGGVIAVGHPDIEYPAFERWLAEHAPYDCTIYRSGQDLDWLARNPELLFPQDSRLMSRWWAPRQWAAIRHLHESSGLDVLVVGRRRADGNNCGPDGIRVHGGRVTYAPIHGWTHEEVLAYIHYHQLPLPPLYGWPNGHVVGTGSWAERTDVATEREGWELLHIIDPSILETAGGHFPLAARIRDEHLASEGA